MRPLSHSRSRAAFRTRTERCSRLTDEPRHAKKARQLRETLYVDFDLTLALHQAGRLNDVRPAKDVSEIRAMASQAAQRNASLQTEWTSRKAPSSPQMPRSSQRSYRELSSELDLDYLIPAAATPLPLAPFSQRSRASSDVDESYTSVLGNVRYYSHLCRISGLTESTVYFPLQRLEYSTKRQTAEAREAYARSTPQAQGNALSIRPRPYSPPFEREHHPHISARASSSGRIGASDRRSERHRWTAFDGRSPTFRRGAPSSAQ